MNVSKGDLAYLLSNGLFDSARHIVEVKEFYGPQLGGDGIVRECWTCVARTDLPMYRGRMKHITKSGMPFTVPDSHLRRISGPSVDIGTETDEPIKEKETA
jgi:hypothetical protein